MCNCGAWARTPDQGTHGGKYPPPNHHQGCEDYKVEKFLRVAYDGTYCVIAPGDLVDLMGEDDGYEVNEVFITRDQFERMPEFDGF